MLVPTKSQLGRPRFAQKPEYPPRVGGELAAHVDQCLRRFAPVLEGLLEQEGEADPVLVDAVRDPRYRPTAEFAISIAELVRDGDMPGVDRAPKRGRRRSLLDALILSLKDPFAEGATRVLSCAEEIFGLSEDPTAVGLSIHLRVVAMAIDDAEASALPTPAPKQLRRAPARKADAKSSRGSERPV